MEAVFQEVYNYVTHCKNTTAQYIATRPIIDLCLVAVQLPGALVLDAVVGAGGH